jgi:hypothetical protein
MKIEQTVCYETLTFKMQTLGNHPEESIRHSEHGESLKLRTTGPFIINFLRHVSAVHSTVIM